MNFKLLFLLIACLSASYILKARSVERADSLFALQKYTEAFVLYETIFEEDKKASPAMLLKMAFIKEGLGNYVSALYYLNTYYQLTSDKKTLNKMREVAEQHDLVGYEYSDVDFFFNVLHRYEFHIIGALLAFSLMLAAYIYRKRTNNELPVTASLLQLLTIVVILLISNDLLSQEIGIVAKDKTLLMTGPSAGAEPVELIDSGHRLHVIEHGELWSKVQWNEQEVYLRKNRLLII
ncbi:MAG: hypothetical protein KI790_17905 [Cyclobacteriaceae bacterium]|nr:hypothetical protein [Cyclobacteriaceae bacterium HetDA_MAG_MS6]